MTVGAERDAQFGTCTNEDFAALSEVMSELHDAEVDLLEARARAGDVMRAMMGKGALRKAVARFAGVSDQTVTNLAHGRKKKEAAS
jgi:hypothetical protein